MKTFSPSTLLRRTGEILRAVHRLSRKRRQAVYLVGGALRDLLQRRPSGKDLDFAVDGEAGDFARELAGEIGGHAFSLNDDFGTWRIAYRRGRKSFDLDFSPLQGGTIEADLTRRDFTMNSLAVPLAGIFSSKPPEVIDPLGGRADLLQGILRANSEESLRRDPLRLLRAFRFETTLGVHLDEESFVRIERNRALVRQAAPERIRGEIFLALEEGAGLFLRRLLAAGLLGEIFPEVEGWADLDQGGHHALPLLEHALRTVEAGEFLLARPEELLAASSQLIRRHFSETLEQGISRRGLFKFIAFFHDSGKVKTRKVEADGRVRFLDHDQEGARINALVAGRLRFSRRSADIASRLTREHMRLLSLAQAPAVTPRAKYRFFRDLGKEGIEAIYLALADAAASRPVAWPDLLGGQAPPELARIRQVGEELALYYFEEFSISSAKPLLNGREIMAALNLPPGKALGDLLARLREAEATGLVRTKEEALQYLKNIDRSR